MNKNIAYEMQEAYRSCKTQGEAVEKVKDKYPDADVNVLWMMWYAIDAYVDMSNQ